MWSGLHGAVLSIEDTVCPAAYLAYRLQQFGNVITHSSNIFLCFITVTGGKKKYIYIYTHTHTHTHTIQNATNNIFKSANFKYYQEANKKLFSFSWKNTDLEHKKWENAMEMLPAAPVSTRDLPSVGEGLLESINTWGSSVINSAQLKNCPPWYMVHASLIQDLTKHVTEEHDFSPWSPRKVKYLKTVHL